MDILFIFFLAKTNNWSSCKRDVVCLLQLLPFCPEMITAAEISSSAIVWCVNGVMVRRYTVEEKQERTLGVARNKLRVFLEFLHSAGLRHRLGAPSIYSGVVLPMLTFIVIIFAIYIQVA